MTILVDASSMRNRSSLRDLRDFGEVWKQALKGLPIVDNPYGIRPEKVKIYPVAFFQLLFHG